MSPKVDVDVLDHTMPFYRRKNCPCSTCQLERQLLANKKLILKIGLLILPVLLILPILKLYIAAQRFSKYFQTNPSDILEDYPVDEREIVDRQALEMMYANHEKLYSTLKEWSSYCILLFLAESVLAILIWLLCLSY